jgi:predicted membrane protein
MTQAPDSSIAAPVTRIALLPLLAAIAIMLALSIRPDLLADAQGHADHGAAALACWGMAAGFVRGVGFVPRFWLWRGLFSSLACASGIALALWRVLG